MRHVFQLDDGTLIAVDAKASTAHLSRDRGETWERIYGKEEGMEERDPAAGDIAPATDADTGQAEQTGETPAADDTSED